MKKVPWKRNLRLLPSSISEKVRRLGKPVVAGVSIWVTREQVEVGLWDHLGFNLNGDALTVPEAVVPSPDMGRWSRTNVEGWEVVRSDLPKVTKTFSFEVPNWGDWSNGSHAVDVDREVYPRDLIPAKGLALRLEVIARDVIQWKWHVRCWVEQVLEPSDRTFDADLLYNLNLLQENTGRADIHLATATVEDYLQSLSVAWEILPPGERDSNIAIILGRRSASTETKVRLTERYDFLGKLKPCNFVLGTSGFQRYFGAQFSDNVVVFENVEYGNAAYVMGDDWQTLSQLSRTELLARAQRDFDRVPHIDGWREVLRRKIKERLDSPPKKAA